MAGPGARDPAPGPSAGTRPGSRHRPKTTARRDANASRRAGSRPCGLGGEGGEGGGQEGDERYPARAGPGLDKRTRRIYPRRKYRGSLRPRSHRSQGPVGPAKGSMDTPQGSQGTHVTGNRCNFLNWLFLLLFFEISRFVKTKSARF